MSFFRQNVRNGERQIILSRSLSPLSSGEVVLDSRPVLILIAEDDPLILMNVEDSLKDAGYEVTTAGNGVDAIARLEAEPKTISALVTDVHLGQGANGWDVAKRARELLPNVPVVYMTADGGPEWTSNGVPNSVLIVKPFAVWQIVTAVSTLLNDLTTHGIGAS